MATSEAVIERTEFSGAHRSDSQHEGDSSGPLSRWFSRLREPDIIQAMLSLFDQAVLSLTNFSSIFLIAKLTSPSELGYYVTAFSLTMFASALQLGLITAPYMMRCQGLERDSAKAYAGNSLLQQLTLSLLTIALLGALAAAAFVFQPGHALAPLLAVLAVSLPLYAVREFYRRIAYAHLHMGMAASMSLVASIIQLVFILAVAYVGSLNAMTAILGLGLGSAAAVAMSIWMLKELFTIDGQGFRDDLSTNWATGKWICGDQLVIVSRGYSMHWVLMVLLGPATTGLYTACASFVMLSNPIQIGFSSYFSARVAAAFHQGGLAKMNAVLSQARWVLVGIIGMFATVLVFGGEWLAVTAYGSEYAGTGALIAVMAITTVIFAVDLSPHLGLWVLSHADFNFRANTIGLVTIIVTGIPLSLWLGVLGAGIAPLIGTTVAFVLKQVRFNQLVRADSSLPDGERETS